MRTWTKKENHFNIGLSVVSKVEGKQEIVGRHAGSGKHHVLSLDDTKDWELFK